MSRVGRPGAVGDGEARGPRRTILSSMHNDDDPYWVDRVTTVSSREHRGLAAWLAAFFVQMWRHDAYVLRGTSDLSEQYRDFLAAVLVHVFRPGRPVVMSDATVAPGSRSLEARLPSRLRWVPRVLARGLVRAADSRSVTWCVLSRHELSTFPAQWGVDPARVVFTPYCYSMHRDPALLPEAERDYVFAGGNSLRDWPLLVAALDGTPARVVVATRTPGPAGSPNITFAPVPPDRFDTLLASARVVVVPLEQSTRSAGQQTYLNAQRLGVPVVVTDGPGARDHVVDGVTGRVVPSDPDALRAAVLRLLDDGDEARAERSRMVAAAQRAALTEFSPDTYRRRLVELATRRPAR